MKLGPRPDVAEVVFSVNKYDDGSYFQGVPAYLIVHVSDVFFFISLSETLII